MIRAQQTKGPDPVPSWLPRSRADPTVSSLALTTCSLNLDDSCGFHNFVSSRALRAEPTDTREGKAARVRCRLVGSRSGPLPSTRSGRLSFWTTGGRALSVNASDAILIHSDRLGYYAKKCKE